MRTLAQAVLTLTWCFLFAQIVTAQLPSPPKQPDSCQPWIGIKSWDVSIQIKGSGTVSDTLGNTASLQESDETRFRLAVDPTLVADTLCSTGWDWTLVESATTNMQINASVFNSGNGCRRDVSYSRAGLNTGGGFLSLNFEKGTYIASVGLVGEASWDTDNYSGPCIQSSSGSGFYDGTGLSYDPSCVGFDPSLLSLISGHLPASGALSGSASYVCPSQALGGLGGFPMASDTNSFSWTVTWSMTPTPLNVNLIVTIPRFDTWRPSGGRTEKEVGLQPGTNTPNSLTFTAQLFDKDSGAPSYLAVDKMTFTLADVSREPGVAMNWPPQATATSDPDLTFDCAFNLLPGGNKIDSQDCTSENLNKLSGTQLEINPGSAQPVSATLSPHDWGGWATLNVTAVVAGTAYQGSLQTDLGNPNILIPKRQSGSLVADSWKAGRVQDGVSDSDDSEDDPKGDGQKGDGFTLYEEYRGFYMGCSDNSAPPQEEGASGATCQHVEGDPSTKDFFVVDDKVGADDGISLFQFASGLNVHFLGLKPEEVAPAGPGYRTINFNHAAAPHVVPQHAVVLQWGTNDNWSKSQVVNTDDYPCFDGSHSCPSLPKHIDRIEIAPSYKFSNLTAGYAAQKAVDVAHELSHSVDVWHHGDIDHKEFWTYDPNTKTNLTSSGPISILLEDSDLNSTDPADLTPADLLLLGLNQINDDNPKDNNGNLIPGRWVYVGNAICGGKLTMHGQHSGDQLSIMRYDNAEAYIPNGFPNVRIWIGPGAEPSGVDLTDHPAGTGVNDPNRKPRPRYGDAFTGRGNDRSQISVNDLSSEISKAVLLCAH